MRATSLSSLKLISDSARFNCLINCTLPISHFILLAPMEWPCLSLHARPLRLMEHCLVNLHPLLCPFWSSSCSSPTYLSCSYGAPCVFPLRFPSALSWSVSSCVLPLFCTWFRVRNVGGPLHLLPVNFYPPYSIVRSRVFQNTVLVLFLLIVIELMCGLHIHVI